MSDSDSDSSSSSSSSSSRHNKKNSKKRSREQDVPSKFSIRVETLPSNEFPPLMMAFPHGAPPASALDTDSGVQWDLKVSEIANGDANNDDEDVRYATSSVFPEYSSWFKLRKVGDSEQSGQITSSTLTGDSDDHAVKYVGSETPGTAKSALLKYAVGVFNKKTNEMQIIGCPQTYNMEQIVKTHNNALPQGMAHLSRMEQLRLRAKQSSNRKAQLAIDRSIMNALTDKNTFEFDMDHADINEDDVLDGQPTSKPDLPPYDLTTEEVQDIYPISEIIDATVLHEVEANTGLIKVIEKPKKISKLDDLTKSVSCARDALLYILSGKTKITKFDMKKRAVLIQYLVYLITLYRHARDSKRNTIKYPKPDSPLEPIPKSVVNAMLQDFSEPSANQPNNITVHQFSPVKLGKLKNYILILALHIHDFKMPLKSICEDLSEIQKNIRPHLMYIGAKNWMGYVDDSSDPDEKKEDEDETEEEKKQRLKEKREKGERCLWCKLTAPLVFGERRIPRRR